MAKKTRKEPPAVPSTHELMLQLLNSKPSKESIRNPGN